MTRNGVREGSTRAYLTIRFVVLAFVGVAVGFLVARFLLPAIPETNILFLVLPILLVATLLFARVVRRGRAGS